jgi:hypothetical protein
MILKYEAILLEKDDLNLTTDEVLNPAIFLAEKEGRASKYKCLDMSKYQIKVWPDLGENFPDHVLFPYEWMLSVN